ncbi:MAG: hypothetical protein GY732_18375 [Gammaproteobacteria bacterium]|nr:hypothetical protein [Gammaproteobacteria bacterium]
MKLKLVSRLFSTVCLLCMSAMVMAQIQLGSDIDGEAAEDHSGGNQQVSLSSDGNRLAVGAWLNDDNGDLSGHVRVYEWSGTDWAQLGADMDGEAESDHFGRSVSLSSDGNRLAIGATGNDGNGTASGHVRIYQWSGTAWTQLGADIDGEATGDQSGRGVSLSTDANRIAIGARRNDDNGTNSGHVRVYHWSGTAWEQLGADIDGEAAYDQFGTSVSLSSDGDRLAVGASHNGSNVTYSSHVSVNQDSSSHVSANQYHAGSTRVYHWSGTAWEQIGADLDGEAAEDFSGVSVSLSSDGDRLAIGAVQNDDNGAESGHVRIYQWSGIAWEQLGSDIAGEAAGDYSGEEVSLSSDGNRLAIGAATNNGNGTHSGHARVYQWSNSAWTQLGEDIDGEAAEDMSGGSVSLSSDGNRLAIGATGNDDNGISSGHVRVYDLSMFNVFNINPGLNDAWYYQPTDGQGFFITVFPDLGAVSLAWFTYDTELSPLDALANLGDPGHRWLTAVGPIDGNQAVMDIEMTSGGIFDTASIIERTNPPGSDGTIILTFDSCNSGTIEYDIPSINRQGISV